MEKKKKAKKSTKKLAAKAEDKKVPRVRYSC